MVSPPPFRKTPWPHYARSARGTGAAAAAAVLAGGAAALFWFNRGGAPRRPEPDPARRPALLAAGLPSPPPPPPAAPVPVSAPLRVLDVRPASEEKEDESSEDISDVLESLAARAPPPQPNLNEQQDRVRQQEDRFRKAVASSKDLAFQAASRHATCGVSIAVAVNGKTVWRQGFGYADVENNLLARPCTVMRIASISKSLTAAAAARLVEQGRLDLDRPVADLLPDGHWPKTHPDITPRQLLSHLSGVRHYETRAEVDDAKMKKALKEKAKEDKELVERLKRADERQTREVECSKRYKTTKESLDVFKNDELLCRPGEAFNYSTHGFTLLAAVVEAVAGEPFEKHMRRLFRDLGLRNTYLDENETIIPNRARQYVRTKQHKLANAPSVDNSWKLAGGGFLSSAPDLAKFGTAMLYSYQSGGGGSNGNGLEKKSSASNQSQSNTQDTPKKTPTQRKPDTPTSEGLDDEDTTTLVLRDLEKLARDVEKVPRDVEKVPRDVEKVARDVEKVARDVEKVPRDVDAGRSPFRPPNDAAPPAAGPFLQPDTVRLLWTPAAYMAKDPKALNDDAYAMGWAVKPRKNEYKYGRDQKLAVFHTGGAVGGSSVLLVQPKEGYREALEGGGGVFESTKAAAEALPPPQGIVVAILTNTDGINLTGLAMDIAEQFEGLQSSMGAPYRIKKIEQC